VRRRIIGAASLSALILTGCGVATSPSNGLASSSPIPTPTASPTVALVGRWELDRTCQAIVRALKKAGHPELIEQDVGELVEGNVDGQVPADWDPNHPCADALPPTPHSHTFWPDGTFNSYDESDQQVDDGTWLIVDSTTFSIGNSQFSYSIVGDDLMFEPVVPADCTGQCRADLGWMYGVSFPGSAWHRVKSGPHVP
jgi:hypothetical protein